MLCTPTVPRPGATRFDAAASSLSFINYIIKVTSNVRYILNICCISILGNFLECELEVDSVYD